MKKTPIRRVSKKRARSYIKYRKLRHAYLEEHPICECCECYSATEVHHKKGRGIYLYMKEYFMSTCFPCHQLIEKERAWANKMGYLLDRIGHE